MEDWGTSSPMTSDLSEIHSIDVSFGFETISLQSNWGFSYGFYFVIISFIIALIAFILELKKTLKIVKIFYCLFPQEILKGM